VIAQYAALLNPKAVGQHGLIRFTYRDAEDLERFHTEVLMRLPGVMRSNSMPVLRTVKKTTALTL
jgi:Lrp/AsnC family transcriptional regulator, leucine-responsive regulatory protein